MVHLPLLSGTVPAARRLGAAAAVLAGSLAASAVPAAGAPITGSASATVTTVRTVPLTAGGAVIAAGSRSGPAAGTALPALGGTAGSLVSMTAGGRAYELPAAALPYLGRGLDPSLFEVAALRTAGSSGRLPVQIRYHGRQPVLPGVTITTASGGTAQGYLTASSEPEFGAALGRQFAADHASGGYGTDGMFAGGLSVSAAGPAPAAPGGAGQVSPRFPMETLTVTGTDQAGRPDTGDMVLIANVDDSGRLTTGQSQAVFYHGTARISVPAGHYFAIGYFSGPSSTGTPFPVTHALDVLPEFTVTGSTAVQVDARAAASEVTMVTPRPAAVRDTYFDIVRTPQSGPAQAWGFANYGWLGGDSPLRVSPTSQRPATGTLATVADQWLASPAGPAPYEYDLAYQNLSGIIPAQRYQVRAAGLATIKERYYLAGAGGFWSRVGSFPVQGGALAFPYDPVNVPGTRTVYSSAGPDLEWATSLYAADQGSPGPLLQAGAARAYHPGEQVSENWDGYPLHPAASVNLTGSRGVPDGFVTTSSANRSGDTLTLDFTPFSDNMPGHTGAGFSAWGGARNVSGSYQIDQDGTQIAAGNAAGAPDLFLQAPLSPASSTIKFTLDAALSGTAGQLSARSRTTWTWTSARESGSTVPPGWQCGPDGSSACRVEPLLTLEYAVPGMAPDGSVPAGRQRLCLTAGHLPLAQAAPVTGATIEVSFDGGSTWQAAPVTAGGRGRFCPAFTAPAGAAVTLRASAADAAGSSITETITDAYRVAS